MNRRTRFSVRTAGLVSLACLAVGCTTTERARGHSKKSDPWVEPTLVMRERITDQAARLPWTHGVERIEAINWFASVGEPAYNTLLNLAADSNASVSGSALAALGATGDSRLVPFVQALDTKVPLHEDPALELEHARTLMRLGDWSKAPALIRGLSNEEPGIRALSIQALRSATGLDFGFVARDPEPERAVAVQRWHEWWQRRSGDEVLAGASRNAVPQPPRRGSER